MRKFNRLADVFTVCMYYECVYLAIVYVYLALHGPDAVFACMHVCTRMLLFSTVTFPDDRHYIYILFMY